MDDIIELDLDKETFKVGKSYQEKVIIDIANRNDTKIKVHSNPACSINYSIKKGMSALYIYFEEDMVHLWFIFIGYKFGNRIYKCVYFEN